MFADVIQAIQQIQSLSSWRAWIEIPRDHEDGHDLPVALLMESVD